MSDTSRADSWLLATDNCLVAAVILVVAGLGVQLNGYPLLDPDEGRNAEVAREMAATNDYVVPHLNGMPYLDKPVLYFAVGAGMMEMLGPTEFAARLPSLLFTLATLTLVGWFGYTLFGVRGGLIAFVATGATPLTLAFARTVIFDSALTLFVSLAVVAFYRASEGSRSTTIDVHQARSIRWRIIGWVALALGLLTKGPIALALPLQVLIPYLAWRKRLDALWDPVGVLTFVAIVLPWIAAMSRAVPGFLEYAVVTETIERLFTDGLNRTEPFWYFFPIVIAGSLPWSLIVIAGLSRGQPPRDTSGRWDNRLVLLVLWIVVPLLFFSLSQSKRPQYMVPLMPAVGLLVAMLWSNESGRAHGARAGGVLLGVVGVILLSARPIVSRLMEVDPRIIEAIPATALPLGALCLVAGVIAYLSVGQIRIAAMALCIPVAAIPVVSIKLMDAIGHDRSARDVAEAIRPVLTSETEIVGVHAYPLSLPFYLQRELIVSTSDGSELTSNFVLRTYRQFQGSRASTLRPEEWWFDALMGCATPRVFVTKSDNDRARRILQNRLPLIIETRKLAAYGPCGSSGFAFASPGTYRGTLFAR